MDGHTIEEDRPTMTRLRRWSRNSQAPAGTFEATPAAALQVGTEYEVLLNHWTRKCSRRSPSPANMEESDAVR
jgi:hypothetical protein